MSKIFSYDLMTSVIVPLYCVPTSAPFGADGVNHIFTDLIWGIYHNWSLQEWLPTLVKRSFRIGTALDLHPLTSSLHKILLTPSIKELALNTFNGSLAGNRNHLFPLWTSKAFGKIFCFLWMLMRRLLCESSSFGNNRFSSSKLR